MTSRGARAVLFALALLLGLFSLALPAGAQSSADKKARQLYLDGDKAYAEGRYEQALESFQQAFELSSRPGLLYNIGNAFERLGRHREAAEALEEYLPHAKAAEKALIKKRIENLKKRAQEQERAREARKSEEESAEAERERAQDAEPEQKPEPAPKPAPAPPAAEGGSSTFGWVMVGVGGVAIVGGAIAGVVALGARSDADAGCSDSGGKRLCSSEARAAIDRDKTFSLLADVGFAVGAVAAGIGIYLILDSDSEEQPRSAGLRASPRRGGGELAFVTTF